MTTEIEALFAKATPRPWAYRPSEYDDWGFIRGPEVEMSFGPGRPIAAVAGCGSDYDANEHRRNNTDPCEPNAALIVHAVNNIERLTSENEALREALAPFADAGEFLDLETDGFLGGEKVSLFHEDFELFDGLKFGDFLRAAKAFAALSKKGEGE